jgi:hypothetical protein
MSHDIVKTITIKPNGEVWFTSCSNNVCPRTPKRWHCTYYTEMLAEHGKEYVELDILRNFYNGNMQGTGTLYGKVAAIYTTKERFEMPEDAYAKLLELRADKKKYVLSLDDGKRFILVTAKGRANVTATKERAKRYSLADALMQVRAFTQCNIQAV